ncbi:MAG: RIP metalloprotease RseP [Parcubacteria bacterium C7867-002]|nr:MAG: RIP metalloprotease RseP [Parcubacteria bacterium C7867-002]
MTALIFLIVLAILIFVHELGHFLAARACGIRVDAFALGFGPRLISWRRKETEYALNAIPFGGYVKIFGENPNEESLNGPHSHRSFVNKPRWQQAVVLVAGVFFNFIFAALLYIIVFSVGVTATTSGFEKHADRFENQRIMVTYVAPGSPAETAGLKTGDVLTTSESIESVQDMIHESGGKPISIAYVRDEVAQTSMVTPVTGIVADKYAIGISMDTVGTLQLPVGTAITEGFAYTWGMMKLTVIGLWDFFGSIFKGAADFASVTGPIGIAGIVGDAADLGFTYLLMITALISINLGVINLIPFPALDGGRLLFVIIEACIRRRIPMSFANAVNLVGFSLLMLLMVVVTYKDIVKMFW